MKLKLICISFIYCIACYGNVQHGYVKTIARENKPSQRVNMVAITLRDSQMVISDSTPLGEGTFSFETQDEYGFRSIRKSGYAVLDKDILAVTKPYTPSPVEVLVYNIAEKEKEKQEYVENQTRVMYTNYRKQMAILEQQVADHIKSEEQVRQERLALQESLDKYQQMVEDIAEYYALLNYEDLDSVEIAIDKAMKAGDMEEAYRLIMQELDINTLVTDSRKEEVEIAEQRALAQKMMDNASIKDSIHRREIEKKADMLYNLHTIYLSRFQNDSAAFCLTQRAELDTTHIMWQLLAGQFILDYIADYEMAEKYMQRALRTVKSDSTYSAQDIGFCYSHLADVYLKCDKHDEAILLYQNSMNTTPHQSQDYIEAIVGLANCYSSITDNGKALVYLYEADSLYKKNKCDCPLLQMRIYQNLGSCLCQNGEFDKGMNFLSQAIELMKKEESMDSQHQLALLYDIAVLYRRLDQYSKSEEIYKKALELCQQIYDSNHPMFASIYNGLGTLFSTQSKKTEALDYLFKAKEVCQERNCSEQYAQICSNIATVYLEAGEIQLSEQYELEAFNIRLKIFGENSPAMYDEYIALGSLYVEKQEYEKAINYIEKSITIRKKTSDEMHPSLISGYSYIGGINLNLGRFEEALKWFQLTLDIAKNYYGEEHSKTADAYNNLGGINLYLKRYEEALKLLNKSLLIHISIYGEMHADVAADYNGIAQTYIAMERYQEAIDNFQKAIEIRKKVFGEHSIKLKSLYGFMVQIYQKIGDSEKEKQYNILLNDLQK